MLEEDYTWVIQIVKEVQNQHPEYPASHAELVPKNVVGVLAQNGMS